MIKRWTGRETRALREAMRMSIRSFADHIGVSHRMVSKWEAGADDVTPRPSNQAALDTAFSCSSKEVKSRFLGSIRVADIQVATTDLVLPSSVSGQSVRHPVDGKLMVFVDEGMFLSGPDNRPQWLPAYYVDVFPTTNADYLKFVESTGHRSPRHWPDGKFPEQLADHPVVFVTSEDAFAYASWATKQLPSAPQWEKAARGSGGNIYPWGTQETFAKCNVRESGNGCTTPVSCYQSGVSPFGVYDLCGNTWEWCSTSSTPGRFELKGSAFTSPFKRAAPSIFNDAVASMSDDDTGFRCVASTEAMPVT